MQKVWFLYIQDTVFGPYTTEQVRQRLSQGVPEESYVWWKGHSEWIPTEHFEQELPKYLDSQNETNQQEMWSFVKAGENFGPFQLPEMIDILRNQLEELDNIKVQSSNMNEWKKVFEIPEVSDLLGISRRENERAPLLGTVKVWPQEDAYLVGRSTTISIGGVGVRALHGGLGICEIPEELEVGSKVRVEIKSPDLEDVVRVQAIVRYKAQEGMYGLVFESPSAETKSVIIGYIRKFKTSHVLAA